MKLDHHHALLADAARDSLQKIRQDKRKLNKRLKPPLARLEKDLFLSEMDVARLRLDCKIGDRAVGSEIGRVLGVPLQTYIRDRRLETAVRLLGRTNLNHGEISELLGCYSSTSAFCRSFKRWCNLQPGAMRRQLRANSPQAGAPADEMLNREFWYPAMFGKLDPEQEYRFTRHVQALYPRSLQLACTEANDDSEPHQEHIDGRRFERFHAECLFRRN